MTQKARHFVCRPCFFQYVKGNLLLPDEEREQIEEKLKIALETARTGYRLSMDSGAPAILHEEASQNFRKALERFHRFVLHGVIPADLHDGIV